MAGKPKSASREYSPAWGGSRGGGPKKRIVRIRLGDRVVLSMHGAELPGVVNGIFQTDDGFSICLKDGQVIGVEITPQT